LKTAGAPRLTRRIITLYPFVYLMTYQNATLAESLDAIASAAVAPAGGTAAAICGAFGTALCEMVCIHTDADSLAAIATNLERQREHLLDLADADATVVDDLFADGSPGSDAAAKPALGVPLTIARACLNVLELGRDVAESGTVTAIADAWTGVHLVYASLQAALFTVRTNLATDADASASIASRAETIEQDGAAAIDAIEQTIRARQ
jgi:formiminotetrahydrofolate cyclodeaminase